MKKRLKWLVLVLCLVMGLSVFAVACGDDDKEEVKLTLNATQVTIYEGQTYQLEATVSPKNTEVTYTSDNTLIAEVSGKGGKITAVNAGTTTVKAKAGDKTVNVAVTVKKFDDPYVIVGDLIRSGTVFKDSLWGGNMITDDDFANNNENKLEGLLGDRWFHAVQGQTGVWSTTLDLYAGSEFKIRQLGKGWSAQINYASNAAWKVSGTGIEEGTSDVDNEEEYLNGKKKSEYVSWRNEEPKSERGFKILIDGNYTFTVTSGTPTTVDFTYNNTIAPAPQPQNFTVTIEKEGADDPLYTKAIAENADLSFSSLTDLAANDVITIKVAGNGEKTEGAKDYVVKGIENLPEGLTQAEDGKITCTAANMYFIAVKLSVECEVSEVSIAAGIPVAVRPHGDFDGSGNWGIGSFKAVEATLANATDKKEVKVTLELKAGATFGFALDINGAQNGWAAGDNLAAGVELPAGLTGNGNFGVTVAGTYEFTFEVEYDATATSNPLNNTKITSIVKK